MPSRTLGDKVEELSKLVAAHTAQIGNLEKEIIRFTTLHGETAKVIADQKIEFAVLLQQVDALKSFKEELKVLAEFKIELAVLQRSVEELQKTKEEWGRRFWAMVGPVVGAAVGVVLGYFLRK